MNIPTAYLPKWGKRAIDSIPGDYGSGRLHPIDSYQKMTYRQAFGLPSDPVKNVIMHLQYA